MNPLPHRVCQKFLKPESMRCPLRVEQLSFLLRRILKVGFAENLERSLSLSLSLKTPFSAHCKSPFSSPPFWLLAPFEEDNHCLVFCLFPIKNSINSIYVLKLWILDIWHTLGHPFSSSLYSCNMCNMRTCYM